MSSASRTALLLLSSFASCQADTYRLSYDGLALPSVVLDHASKAESSSLLPPTLAEEAAVLLGSNLIETGLGTEEVNKLPLDIECVALKTIHEGNVRGTKCSTDFATVGFSFSILIGLYMPEDELVEDDLLDKNANSEKHTLPAALRVDVTLTALLDSMIARDILTKAVPVLDKVIGASNAPSSFWTIERRPSLLEMRQGLYQIPEEASIDKRVLSTPNKMSRVLTASSRNERDSTHPSSSSIDIWSYKEPNNMHEVTHDLFINSTLRATTNAASQAHAEAMVHPALIAHPYPNRVAIISDAPLAFVKELRKYYVEWWSLDISIVGVDLQTLDMTRTFMPLLDDCSGLIHADDSCLDSASITIEEDVDDWIESLIDDIDPSHYGPCIELDDFPSDYKCAPPPLFDVILLDVSIDRKHHWLSLDFHKKLKQLLNDESILVINDGSEPDVDINFEFETDNALRDAFLSKVSIDQSLGGLGYQETFVYDEPAAAPLNTAFIVCFPSAKGEESYYRFVRDTPTAIDLDIVSMFDSMSTLPTNFYDGATHMRYIRPSRMWENWYCQSWIGKDMPVCSEFRPRWYNSSFHSKPHATEIRHDEIKGRALYAIENITKDSFMMSSDSWLSIHLDVYQFKALQNFVEDFPDAEMYKNFLNYVIAYGYESEPLGGSGWSVSIASNNTFTNHACTEEEGLVQGGYQEVDKDGKVILFSPIITRRVEAMNVAVVQRDIEAGEEITQDYHSFRTSEDPDFNTFLDSICATGEGLIPVDHRHNNSEL